VFTVLKKSEKIKDFKKFGDLVKGEDRHMSAWIVNKITRLYCHLKS